MKSSFPASQASCRVSFPPCCSYAEVARVLLTLISPICAWKGKTYRHIGLFGIVFVITRISLNRGDTLEAMVSFTDLQSEISSVSQRAEGLSKRNQKRDIACAQTKLNSG